MEQLLIAHCDLKRGMWNSGYLSRWNRLMAGWGYNHVLLEIEDKYGFRDHPLIAHRDALTSDQLRAHAAAMRAAGLEPIPMVQSIAHAEYVLKHPAYAHLREHEDHDEQYEPTSSKVHELIFDLCDDLIEVCQPKQFFHLGGDESWRLGTSPRYRSVVADVGVGELYVRHMLPILDHIHERGLRPIIWADIVLSHPEVIARLPKYVILMDWDYWTRGDRVETFLNLWGIRRMARWSDYAPDVQNPAFDRHIAPYLIDEETRRTGCFRGFATADALHAMGFDLITASAARCMGDSIGIPCNSMHLPNAFFSARKGMSVGLGTCVTSWAVRHVHPEATLAAFHAAARSVSQTTSYDFGQTVRSFAAEFFGADLPDLPEVMRLAERHVPFAQAHELNRAAAVLDAGGDPFADYLARGGSVEGGNPRRLREVIEAQESYRQARRLLLPMRAAVTRHHDALECWIEGLDLVMAIADIDQALLEGRMKNEAGRHGEALARCRDTAQPLLSMTYTENGVQTEAALRYGVLDRAIRRYGQGA